MIRYLGTNYKLDVEVDFNVFVLTKDEWAAEDTAYDIVDALLKNVDAESFELAVVEHKPRDNGYEVNLKAEVTIYTNTKSDDDAMDEADAEVEELSMNLPQGVKIKQYATCFERQDDEYDYDQQRTLIFSY